MADAFYPENILTTTLEKGWLSTTCTITGVGDAAGAGCTLNAYIGHTTESYNVINNIPHHLILHSISYYTNDFTLNTAGTDLLVPVFLTNTPFSHYPNTIHIPLNLWDSGSFAYSFTLLNLNLGTPTTIPGHLKIATADTNGKTYKATLKLYHKPFK